MSFGNSTTSTINAQSQLLSQYLSLTVGFILLISGIIGNCLNILVFLTFGNYKRNACSQYMLAGSLFDLLFLLLGLTTRIFGQGFNMDFTLTSRIWCKMRSSLLDINSLCSFTCVCLQSIDVFLTTSRSVTMRQKSNIKIARCLLIGFAFLWIVHETPSFVFQNLIFTNGTPACLTTNSIYASYHTYVNTLMLTVCVPIIVISFFTFGVYRHLHSLTPAQRRFIPVFSRQVTRMALFQIGVVLVFQCPFGIETAYFLGTTNLAKSPDRRLQDKLTQAFFNVYVYGLYASSFYCYCAASKRFRHQVVDAIKRLIFKQQANQIIPVTLDLRKTATQQQTAQL